MSGTRGDPPRSGRSRHRGLPNAPKRRTPCVPTHGAVSPGQMGGIKMEVGSGGRTSTITWLKFCLLNGCLVRVLILSFVC